MKPAPFDYVRPETVAQAVAALAEAGEDGRVLAGGQSLVPMLNMRLARPSLLVDIGGLVELRGIKRVGDSVEIGAGVTQRELGDWPELAETLPVVAKALPHIGHVQTRNRGTVCGSIAHADPSAELPLCLVLSGGTVVLQGRRRRAVAAQDFFTGMFSTARRSDEIVTAVRFPTARPGTGHAFREVAERHGDYALIALAATVAGGTVTLAVGAVADRPVRRSWPDLPENMVGEAVGEWAATLDALDDHHASAAYRRGLLRRLGPKVIAEARSCAA